MRLIDADALRSYMDECSKESRFRVYYGYAESFINDAPTIDAVPVVRCRDCRYCDPSNGAFWCDRFDSAVQIDGMAYCSYGKRKLKEETK